MLRSWDDERCHDNKIGLFDFTPHPVKPSSSERRCGAASKYLPQRKLRILTRGVKFTYRLKPFLSYLNRDFKMIKESSEKLIFAL
jgi:hypothetical protein